MVAGWVVAHAGLVYVAAVVGGFAAVAAWETRAPLGPLGAPLHSRWAVNISLLFLNNALVHAVLPVAAVGIALQAQARGWGLLPRLGLPAWALALVAFFAMDLVRWLLHATLHRLPWLWHLHRVHHSDTDYDCTIGLRFHPLEALLTSTALLGAVFALGVPPVVVVLSDALTIALGFVAHGNVSLPRRCERLARRLLVTPETHRIHHSTVRSESMSNFGSVFSFWDRLFGTFTAPATAPSPMQIGLDDMRDASQLTLLRLLWMPFSKRAAPGPASNAAR